MHFTTATFLLLATAATGVMSAPNPYRYGPWDRPAHDENCNATILLGTKDECEAVKPTGYLTCKTYVKNGALWWMPCKPL